MIGAELFEPDLRARIDQARASAEEAWRTLNPDLAPNLGEARKILAERQLNRSHLNRFTVGERMAAKHLAKRAAELATLADSKRCLADNEASGAAARARAQTKGLAQRRHNEEAGAHELAADWVRGVVVGAEPGGVIAWREKNKVEHVRPLPLAEEHVERAELDVAESMRELIAALDNWDRRHGFRKSPEVEQPAASVK
jgi:hypothetical protein